MRCIFSVVRLLMRELRCKARETVEQETLAIRAISLIEVGLCTGCRSSAYGCAGRTTIYLGCALLSIEPAGQRSRGRQAQPAKYPRNSESLPAQLSRSFSAMSHCPMM